MRRVGLGLVLLAACSHNVPKEQALSRAKAAHARGDLVGEALALRDACTADPKDKDLCKRGEAAWQAAQTASIEIARKACATVENQTAVDQCLTAVGEVRRMSPNDAQAAQLAEAAAKQQLAHCVAEAPNWQTSVEDGLEVIRCEDSRAKQVQLASYDAETSAVRVAVKDQLLGLLQKPGFSTKKGAASEVLGAAACLTSAPDLVEQARAARVQFVEQARASIDLRAQATQSLPDLCQAIAGQLGGRAACATAKDGPQLTIAGDISLLPVEHSAFETEESKDYVAGIIRERNPAYDPARRDEQETRTARDSAEQQYLRDKSDCDTATSSVNSSSSCSSGDCPQKGERDRACNRMSTSQSLFQSRDGDYNRAKSHLDATPRELEREDIRTARYVVKHHSWKEMWRAKLRSDGQTIDADGGTQAEDLETSGAPVAGVPADPLTRPGDRWYIPAVREQVAGKMTEIADAALKRRAADLRNQTCTGELAWTADWVDCYAKYAFWGGSPAAMDELLKAVSAGSDHKRGAAWPALVCK